MKTSDTRIGQFLVKRNATTDCRYTLVFTMTVNGDYGKNVHELTKLLEIDISELRENQNFYL